jgi:hypothetical protein
MHRHINTACKSYLALEHNESRYKSGKNRKKANKKWVKGMNKKFTLE